MVFSYFLEYGTYIVLTEDGFRRFKLQQNLLLSYIDNTIDILGFGRFKEILKGMEELESALNEASPAEL